MRRTLIFLLMSSCALAHAGEVKLRISGSSGLTGTAHLVNKLQSDGTKYVLMEMELHSTDGQIVNVTQESVYDRSGMPVRMIQNTDTKGGKSQKIVATFEAGSVRVRVTDDGKVHEDTMVVPPGTTPMAKYEFWFLRDKIAPGGKTAYSRFDLQTLKWERVEAFFGGTRDLKVGTKTVKANYVTIGSARAWVDDQGDPWRVEMEGIVLERVS